MGKKKQKPIPVPIPGAWRPTRPAGRRYTLLCERCRYATALMCRYIRTGKRRGQVIAYNRKVISRRLPDGPMAYLETIIGPAVVIECERFRKGKLPSAGEVWND